MCVRGCYSWSDAYDALVSYTPRSLLLDPCHDAQSSMIEHFLRIMACKPRVGIGRVLSVCLSVCLSSVVLSGTIVDLGQTAMVRVMISSQPDRASIWVHHAPTTTRIG